jgi:hypothetical protein
MSTLPLEEILGQWAVGSGDWGWAEERDLLDGDPKTAEVAASIAAEGIREPVLLGNDGRVWDGHHRIVIAWRLGLATVPVEYA